LLFAKALISRIEPWPKPVLLTSLLDRRRFRVQDLADCYRRRREIESSYREQSTRCSAKR